jgi:hypothetical protein
MNRSEGWAWQFLTVSTSFARRVFVVSGQTASPPHIPRAITFVSCDAVYSFDAISEIVLPQMNATEGQGGA